MSRWYRAYAGMARDEKLVRVAIRAKQPVERVVWVWIAILESAAEIDAQDGRYDIDEGEIAYFIRCEPDDVKSIVYKLYDENMVSDGAVVGFHRKYGPRSARMPWSDWAVTRLCVFQRDDYKCRYCGASGVALECDHVLPVSRGGSNDKTNLVAACKKCNREKGDKTPEEMGWSL